MLPSFPINPHYHDILPDRSKGILQRKQRWRSEGETNTSLWVSVGGNLARSLRAMYLSFTFWIESLNLRGYLELLMIWGQEEGAGISELLLPPFALARIPDATFEPCVHPTEIRKWKVILERCCPQNIFFGEGNLEEEKLQRHYLWA